jgi:hypothetical protein
MMSHWLSHFAISSFIYSQNKDSLFHVENSSAIFISLPLPSSFFPFLWLSKGPALSYLSLGEPIFANSGIWNFACFEMQHV